ncbi:hypothetical protein AB0J83_34825 [Actinoplanes sp. NPDC049596]|uniref:hypothetical protein n=1 Tax=unclassified Actinoplanes TaxID=2626549 RepID=UPI0034374F70
MSSPREIFHALQSRPDPGLLAAWDRAPVRDLLAPLATYGGWRRETYVFGDLLEQAYALSRLSDVLLLGFQPPLPAGATVPYAHTLHLDADWPRITVDQYLSTFAALGLTPIPPAPFDPFFHEIVAVEQTADPASPIEIVEVVWPGLLLGDLLFSRSGVRIRAGAHNAVAGVADRSTLHDVFLRRHRDTSDGSFGWGHNSQWKTDFRRDYLTPDTYHFNVDADFNLDDGIDPSAPDADALHAARLNGGFDPLDDLRTLIRHRCLVRPPISTPDPETFSVSSYRLSWPRLH